MNAKHLPRTGWQRATVVERKNNKTPVTDLYVYRFVLASGQFVNGACEELMPVKTLVSVLVDYVQIPGADAKATAKEVIRGARP